MIDVVDFKAEHLIGILHEGAVECGVIESPGDGVLSLAMSRENTATCWSGFAGDKLWACGGVDILWAGVGEAWAFFSPAIKENPLAITRAVKKILVDYLQNLDLHRIQCHVRHNLKPAVRFVQALGFEQEGINRRFTHDKVDCLEFAMVT
jgi:hypothetical protein